MSFLDIGCMMTDVEQQVEHVLRRRLKVGSGYRGPWLIQKIGWNPRAGDEYLNPWEIADELEQSCRKILKK